MTNKKFLTYLKQSEKRERVYANGVQRSQGCDIIETYNKIEP